jgi:hypothetical protein
MARQRKRQHKQQHKSQFHDRCLPMEWLAPLILELSRLHGLHKTPGAIFPVC